MEFTFPLLFIVILCDDICNAMLNSCIDTFNFLQGDFFQLKVDNEGQHFTKISSYGRHFVWLCLVNPSGDHIATLNASGCISTWAVRNGNLVCMELLL